MEKKLDDIMDYIKGFIKSEGYPPAYKEIGVAVGYSLNSSCAVSALLDELEAQGRIERKPYTPRSIRVTEGM